MPAKYDTRSFVFRPFLADVTHWVDPAWLAKHGVAKVYEYGVYNRGRAVHIASLTPSWEVENLGYAYALTPEAEAAYAEGSDEYRERVADAVEDDLRRWEPSGPYVGRNPDDGIRGWWTGAQFRTRGFMYEEALTAAGQSVREHASAYFPLKRYAKAGIPPLQFV